MSQSSLTAPSVARFTGAYHHGSDRYVSNPYLALGGPIEQRARVGRDLRAEAVQLRSTSDWNQHFTACVQQGSSLWGATTRMVNARVGYRFLIATRAGALTLNASGLHEHEVTDADDLPLGHHLRAGDSFPHAGARIGVRLLATGSGQFGR